MALAFVFSRATIWSSEWRTSSRLPRASNTTQTMSTLATLTAAFRQKFCQALLKAKSMRFQSRCMVPSCIFVSDNLATFNGHHPPPHHVDNLAVVRRHHHGRPTRVDLQQQLDDLPRCRRVQVAGGLIGEEDPWIMDERPRDGHPLLLTAGQLVGELGFLALQPDDAEHFLDLGLEVAQGALGNPQGEGDILEDREIGQQLEILEDHADLPAQERQVAPLQPAQILSLHRNRAGGDLLLPDQETNQGRLPRTARPDQEDEILLGNLEGHIPQRDRPVRIGLLHMFEVDLRGSRDYDGHARPLGHLAVVGADGRVRARLGDPDHLTYFRSCAKPFQSVGSLGSGIVNRFDLRPEHVAIMSASHNGEARHVEVVRDLLARAAIPELALQCGAHWPIHDPSAAPARRQMDEPLPIFNNCSGKHAGMLAAAKALEAPLETYLERNHPVQRRISEVIAEYTRRPLATTHFGVDGCSAPNPAVPLAAMARSFAALVQAKDGAPRDVVAAMTEHPFLVAGTDRFDTRLMEATRGRLLAKAG